MQTISSIGRATMRSANLTVKFFRTLPMISGR
jgi:hypothetical protein